MEPHITRITFAEPFPVGLTRTRSDVKISSIAPCSDGSQPIIDLPPEMLLRIFAYMKPQDICRISLVCKRWNILATDPVLQKEQSELFKELTERYRTNNPMPLGRSPALNDVRGAIKSKLAAVPESREETYKKATKAYLREKHEHAEAQKRKSDELVRKDAQMKIDERKQRHGSMILGKPHEEEPDKEKCAIS